MGDPETVTSEAIGDDPAVTIDSDADVAFGAFAASSPSRMIGTPLDAPLINAFDRLEISREVRVDLGAISKRCPVAALGAAALRGLDERAIGRRLAELPSSLAQIGHLAVFRVEVHAKQEIVPRDSGYEGMRPASKGPVPPQPALDRRGIDSAYQRGTEGVRGVAELDRRACIEL